MSLAENILKTLEATPLTRETAPGLYSRVEDVAAKLRSPMPTFHLVPEKSFGHPILDMLSRAPNAGSLSKTDIIMSKPILRLFESTDLTKPITEEMKSILAHEMHHCANRGSLMAMSRMPVLAMPVVAVAATMIYDRAHAKAKKDGDTSPENMEKHVDCACKETRDSLPSNLGHSAFFKGVVTAGKYIAVATIGLGAGLLMARYGSRHHEFAADLFASQSVANKEVAVSALRKIHKAVGASISEVPEAEKFQGIIGETILAHPNFAERAAHIRSH